MELGKINVTEDLLSTKDELMEFAMLVGYAVAATTGKLSDELSKHEAQALYGHTWINKNTQEKNLIPYRNGSSKNSTLVYSRFDIEALKMSEKLVSKRFAKCYSNATELYKKMSNNVQE